MWKLWCFKEVRHINKRSESVQRTLSKCADDSLCPIWRPLHDAQTNMARIVNSVQCHSLLSGQCDCNVLGVLGELFELGELEWVWVSWVSWSELGRPAQVDKVMVRSWLAKSWDSKGPRHCVEEYYIKVFTATRLAQLAGLPRNLIWSRIISS